MENSDPVMERRGLEYGPPYSRVKGTCYCGAAETETGYCVRTQVPCYQCKAPPLTVDTDNLLQERGTTHGKFEDGSYFSQNIKNVIKIGLMQPRTLFLSNSQREALDMIAHKIGRILAGNPNFSDHWEDIAGYATLIVKELANAKRNDGQT